MQTGTKLDDKAWRLAHCYEIVDKQGQRRTMTPNVIQQRLQACKAQRKMILKARQMGATTYCLLDQYDDVITTPNTTAAIIAHEQDAVRKLFRIPQRAYKFSHPLLKPMIDRGGGSQYEMYFPQINSRIYCDLAIRGDTIQIGHVSEAHFIRNEDDLKATIEAVPIKTGKLTLESTANGIGGMFYDLWTDPDSNYEKFFFPWFIFPEYALETEKLRLTLEEKAFIRMAKKQYAVDVTHAQIAFRRFKQRDLKHLYNQEYPEDDVTCFLASGAAAMDLLKVKRLMEAAPKPLRTEEADGCKITIFREYNNGHLYGCGADVAEGVEKDASHGSMFDVNTREQVATIHSDTVRPGDFGHALHRFCERYVERDRPWPKLGVERNNHGHTTLYVLENEIHYPNLYHRPSGDGVDDRPGWVTDRVTRPVLLDTFIEGVEQESVKLSERATFQECLTLINNSGKIEAAEGKHDDRVIASAIGIQMVIASSPSALYENISGKILSDG